MGEICYGCFSQLAKGGACPHCGYDPGEDIGKYPAALKPGTILNNRYILGRVLGQGGFGITYAAQDKRSGERVAIKEYLPTAIASREVTGQVSSFGTQIENFERGKEGFMEEANSLVDFMNNSHIVSVYDLFEANGTVYFVMEYVQGKNLKEYVKIMGGKLGQEAVNRILLPIMEALEDVHSKGLVHRDIAPDNIIVTADGSAKLIDFGAARYSTGEKSLSLDVILKHGFAPKEQYLRRGRQGAFTDVYAMAATYYYAVTGKTPPDALQRMEEDELVSPSLFGAKLSPNVEEALMKALELQPADRYQTMGKFARAIQGEAATVPTPVPIKPQPIVQPEPIKKEALKKPEPIKKEAPAKKKSKKPLIFVLAAVLALVAIFAGVTMMQPKEPSVSSEAPTPVEPAEPMEPVSPWSFDAETGTLFICGEGRMEEFVPEYNNSVPWKEFSGQIKNVIIKDGVTSIGNRAFYSCSSLVNIDIPDSVANIGNHAFYNCGRLGAITIPQGITSIGNFAFYNCGRLMEISIPKRVRSIGASAFSDCSNLSSIELPDGIKSISDSMFSNCKSLNEIVIPDGVIIIEDSAFSDCSNLSSVKLSDSVTSIGANAFQYCSNLSSIELPDSVANIGKGAFQYCSNLSSIKLPDSVTSIGAKAFQHCSNLSSVELPDSVTSIVSGAFQYCSNLSSIKLPDSVTNIGSGAFQSCSNLSSIKLPDSVISIETNAFQYCSNLSSIELPDRVTSIGSGAFYNCSKLEVVTIPEGVTSIGSSAFYRCDGLKDIYYAGTDVQWEALGVNLGYNVRLHFSYTD